MTTYSETRIEKEDIECYSFAPLKSQLTQFQISERQQKLYLAMLLGNNYRTKVTITFNTAIGLRQVVTTVWAATEKFVVLKGGKFIPIQSIAELDLQ